MHTLNEIIELTTNRLILKGISYQLMTEIFETWPKEELMRFLGLRNDDEYRVELEKHREGYSSYNRRFIVFLLIENKSKQVIGRCGIHNWNRDNNRAEIGYFLNDVAFRNQGLMTEAVTKILKYGFQALQLNRIDAIVGVKNIPSLKLVENIGFKKEGILRGYLKQVESYEDAICFSMLQEEFNVT